MNADSGREQDTEQASVADRDSGSAKQLSTNVRGIQGERIIKALTKIEEKKTKHIARQEQVDLLFIIQLNRIFGDLFIPASCCFYLKLTRVKMDS